MHVHVNNVQCGSKAPQAIRRGLKQRAFQRRERQLKLIGLNMGFWAAMAKSNTSNMKINRPPVSWSERSDLPASDLRGASDKYMGSTRGL